MRVWIKEGVCGDLCPELRKALGRIQRLYATRGLKNFYITSKREGNHMLGSFHYDGRAVDFMRLDVPVNLIQEAAGVDCDVVPFIVHGETYTHLEWDPKSKE